MLRNNIIFAQIKNRKSMKQFLFFITVFAAVLGVVFASSKSSVSDEASNLVMENIEAIAVIEIINGEAYIVDEIPCYGGGISVEFWETYTKCQGCEEKTGHGTGASGTCTSVKKLSDVIGGL